MRFAGLVTKATDTSSEYVILIGFLRQNWLGERAWILYMYTACPVFINRMVLTVLSLL